ncbi:cell surface A33 antigen [Eulemur rufifrons]|uniref:cell surface A33 antigen n=1 Tax=Eulemur rufifrons TaxID=859984 RepID=UPI0037445921
MEGPESGHPEDKAPGMFWAESYSPELGRRHRRPRSSKQPSEEGSRVSKDEECVFCYMKQLLCTSSRRLCSRARSTQAPSPLSHCICLHQVWLTADAISVETTQDVLRAARGSSVTLPCTYRTSARDRNGLIQWDKLLRSHSERVVIWNFLTKTYTYGDLYENRVNISKNAQQSDASITISQLTMDDNGTYECSVSLLSDLDGTSKARARLLVLVPPSKPECSIEGEPIIGNDIQVTCQSAEGSPAPQYSWKRYNLLNQEQSLTQPVSGQPLYLKNISTDTSGYYICTSSNDVGTQSCNITVAARLPSMNVALYAGIAGGVVAAFIVIGIVIYCCCCRGTDKAEDKEDARPNRADYQEPPEQLRELSRGKEEEEEEDEDPRSSGPKSPDPAGRESPDPTGRESPDPPGR